MKAILCKAYGPPESLVLEEVPAKKAGKGEVLVEVQACGVNFPDTLIIQGLYQFKPNLPFSPGGDIAGVVKEVGEGATRFKPGDRVFSMLPYGGFAEEAVVAQDVCFPMPENMSFTIAASFLMAYGTSYHALKDRAQLKAGETLVVLGAAGGVGLTAVELGKLMGARVIAAASTEEKLALCRAYGAAETINYLQEDLKSRIKELTGGRGADVIYDPVGGDFAEPAFRAIGWKGRYLVIGFTAGRIPKIPLNLPLLKGAAIMGVFLGNFALRWEPEKAMQNNMELMQMYLQGKIKPHIHKVYPLEKAPQALQDMMDRKVKGKVVVQVRNE